MRVLPRSPRIASLLGTVAVSALALSACGVNTSGDIVRDDRRAASEREQQIRQDAASAEARRGELPTRPAGTLAVSSRLPDSITARAARRSAATSSTVKYELQVADTDTGIKDFCAGRVDLLQLARTLTAAEQALCTANGLKVDKPMTIGYAVSVLVTRNGQILRIPIKALLHDAEPSANLLLTGGEEIRIPEAGKITVVGNVNRPGAFPVREAGDYSVLKLVALSEGLMPYAEHRAFIIRRDENGADQEVPVELEKIMKREAPDVTLAVGDILYIPDNKKRRTTMGIIDRVTSFGATTASGVLIWRR